MVTPTATLVIRIRSLSEITETSAVSLSRLTHRLPRPGSANRQTCGSWMRVKICTGRMPMAFPASIWPRVSAWNAPRSTSPEKAPNTSASAITPAVNGLKFDTLVVGVHPESPRCLSASRCRYRPRTGSGVRAVRASPWCSPYRSPAAAWTKTASRRRRGSRAAVPPATSPRQAGW